jgi:hypothetical protein
MAMLMESSRSFSQEQFYRFKLHGHERTCVLADCILVTCQFGLQYDSFGGCHREGIAPALRKDIRDVLPV